MDGYVRVSQILARFQSYADVDPEVLEAKAKIGTNVHKAIVQDQADELVIHKGPREKAYFESYEMWKANKHVQIKQVPRLYCHELMLTGECDGLIFDQMLIDWKCSASPSKEVWNMQAHMYWYLLTQNGYKIVNNMRWINLKHRKSIHKCPETNLGEIVYYPLEPVEYKFEFDQNVLDKCLSEVIKYWEEMYSAKVVD